MILSTAAKAILSIAVLLVTVAVVGGILFYLDRRRRMSRSQNQQHVSKRTINVHSLVSHMHTLNLGPYPDAQTLANGHPQHQQHAQSQAQSQPQIYAHDQLWKQPQELYLTNAHHHIDNSAGRTPQLRTYSNADRNTQFVLGPPPASAKKVNKKSRSPGVSRGHRGEYVDIELGRS